MTSNELITGIPASVIRSAGVLVAVSGGLDSTVLLHALADCPPIRERGLRAIHVHHGLQADADAWAAHCERVCVDLDVALQVVRVAVDPASGDGPEAAARDARLAAFARVLGENEALALAHHRDDQAETFLLRALRASGPDGLAAMRAWRRFGSGWLWRPLLGVPRSELLAYARQHRLRWIEDPSNDDTRLDRNFLRQRVLPLLRERWPHADASFARAAALAAEAADLLAGGDAEALAAARTDDRHSLSVEGLRRLSPARRARVLRRWVAALDLPPLPAAGIASVEASLLDARPDAGAEFAWHGAVLRRWRGLLHADVRRAPLPGDYRVEWNGLQPLQLPTGDVLALAEEGEGEKRGQSEFRSGVPTGPGLAPAKLHSDPFSPPLLVHARRGGERITLPGRGHSHALKHVLQDLVVPPWVRERLPLLSDAEGRLLAAADIAYSAPFDAWLRERGVRLQWTTATPQERTRARSCKDSGSLP